jgi:hypothetical protein
MTFAGNVQHEMGRAAYSILPGNSPGIHRDANAAENARRTGARAFRGKHALPLKPMSGRRRIMV